MTTRIPAHLCLTSTVDQAIKHDRFEGCNWQITRDIFLLKARLAMQGSVRSKLKDTDLNALVLLGVKLHIQCLSGNHNPQ